MQITEIIKQKKMKKEIGMVLTTKNKNYLN